MKSLKIAGGMIIIFLLVINGIAFIYLNKPTDEKVDIVLLNSMAQSAAACWDDLSKMEEKDFNIPYVILNKEDQVIYQSTTKPVPSITKSVPSIEAAIKEKLSYMNIVKDQKWLGEVVLLERGNKEAGIKSSIQKALAIISVGIAGAVSFCLLYLYRKIVRPFNKLQGFAKEVARGNLELPLEMEKDNIFGSFTESFDMMREELKEARKKAYEAKQREKELVAALSHDIKTPVTGIKLISEVLALQVKEPLLQEKVNTIYKKAEQINDLVTDLFSSTLEELGEFRVEPKEEYAAVLSDIVEKMTSEGKISQEKVPECMIYIDLRRMEQVIGNIISNSYKYAGTKIEIKYKFMEDYLQMTLRDSGKGVPEEELPLVFNKFYRGKLQSVQEKSGAGLGLYISKVLMEKMGGEISCYNLEDGFEVKLLIPIACMSLSE